MGRPERPVDPDAGPRERFAYDLRMLRQQAGQPTYRELARRAHFSDTTLSVAAAGASLPSLEVTVAFVAACDGDVAEWTRRWHAVDAELRAAPSAATAAQPPAAAGTAVPAVPAVAVPAFSGIRAAEPASEAPPAPPQGRRWKRRRRSSIALGLLAAALVLGGSALGVLAVATRGHPAGGRDRQGPAPLPSVPGVSSFYKTFTATAGPGCRAQPGASFTVSGSWQREADSHAATPADVNCGGVFLAAGRSQDSGHPTSTAEWGFDTNGGLRCSLSFWVPPVSGATGSARYDLIAANGRTLAHYTINQGLDAGLFVSTTRYRLTSGKLRVRLTNAGRGTGLITAASVDIGCS